jgi:hypothetical protein
VEADHRPHHGSAEYHTHGPTDSADHRH